MPAWSEAKRAGRAAHQKISKSEQHSRRAYTPSYPASSGRCFLCGGRLKLRTGTVGGTPVLWCAKHEDTYRDLHRDW